MDFRLNEEEVPQDPIFGTEQQGELPLCDYDAIAPKKDPAIGSSNIQGTVCDDVMDLMDVEQQGASTSHENAHQVVIDPNTPDNAQYFFCRDCPEKFSSFESLIDHLPCIPRNPDKFICELCLNPYKTERTLQMHMKNVHGGDQKEACHTCGARFATKRSLTFHRKKQHPDSWATCNICQMEYKSRRSLDYHKRTAHEGNPLLSCDKCNAKFASKYSLTSHKNKQHYDGVSDSGRVKKSTAKNTTIHKCTHCAFSSKHKVSVSRHYERVHSDNAPEFPCSYDCGYIASTNASRVRHELSCRLAPRRV